MTSAAMTETVPATRTTKTDSGTGTTSARTRRPRCDLGRGRRVETPAISSPRPTPPTVSPALDREVTSEGEALVEALRLGVTYYEVQEFRVVPDFAGRKPQLNKEAVNGK